MPSASTTAEVSLRELTIADTLYVFDVENDPEVWLYSDDTSAPYSIEEITEFCESITDGSRTDFRRYVILYSNTPSGFIDLYDIATNTPSLLQSYVSILVHPLTQRGNHIGTKALKLLEAKLSHQHTTVELTALIPPSNQASHNFFLSCGYIPTTHDHRGHLLTHSFN